MAHDFRKEHKLLKCPCPFCGAETISLFKRVFFGWWSRISPYGHNIICCPNCGAIIRHGIVYRIIQYAAYAVCAAVFMINPFGVANMWDGLTIFMLPVWLIAYRLLVSFFDDMDYDVDTAHPKPHYTCFVRQDIALKQNGNAVPENEKHDKE